ncbi:Histone-lysine N-methyltransferase PRDM16, partial [Frankliniella fusca]
MAKNHECPTCFRVFDRPAKLKRHRLIHTREEFVCDICQRHIKKKCNFDRHVQSHQSIKRCDVCEKTFSSKRKLEQHVNRVHGPHFLERKYKCADCRYEGKTEARLYTHRFQCHLILRQCEFCLQGFRNPRSFRIHQKFCQSKKQETLKFICFYCRKRYGTLLEKMRHTVLCRRVATQTGRGRETRGGAGAGAEAEAEAGPARDRVEWEQPTYALRGVAAQHRLYENDNSHDLGLALIEKKDAFVQKLNSELAMAKGLKFSLHVKVAVSREREVEGNPQVEQEIKSLSSETRTLLLNDGKTKEHVESAILDIMNSAEYLNVEGSSWVVTEVFFYELQIAQYRPLKGGSYIKTPAWLGRKRVVLNVKTTTNHECFRLSILTGLFSPISQRGIVDPRNLSQHYQALNFGELKSSEFKVKDVDKFCALNPLISLHILGVENKEIFPLYCPSKRLNHHITLLLMSSGQKQHYVFVQCLDRLLYSQNKHKARSFFCCYCLCSFSTSDARDSHEGECKINGGQKVTYPKENSFLEFDASFIRKQSNVSHFCFFDFETFLSPCRDQERVGRPTERADGSARQAVPPAGQPMLGEGTAPKTRQLNEHIAFAYCLMTFNDWGEPWCAPVVYEGENAAEHFLDSLFEIEERLFTSRQYFPLSMSVAQEEMFERATHCHICGKIFKKEDVKVKDHHHYQSIDNYLGAAHQFCNLQRQRAHFLPVSGHNLSGFDLHIVVRAAINHPKIKKCDINVIPQTMDTYRGLTLTIDRKNHREIRFIDSYQHMAAPLDVFQFWSAPSLSLACAVRYTQCRIELMSCPDMFGLVERGVRGGVAYASLRYGRANRPELPCFRPEEPITSIYYFDINALYSYCMLQPLPVGSFEWLSPDECAQVDVSQWGENYAAFFEVDLEYTIQPGESSHHQDWPLAPMRMTPKQEWFSEYQREVGSACGMSFQRMEEKLMAVIGPRKKYCVHSALLQFYIERGMRVTRWYRGLKFRQEAFLAPYIDYLTKQRHKTSNPFMSNYFKAQANSLYGSMLRRPRKDRCIKLVQTREQFLKRCAQPSFKNFKIFGGDLVAVESIKKKIYLCQPIFCAAAVLDLSKLHMTRVFWEIKSHFVKQKEKDLALCLTDTDSAVCLIKSDNHPLYDNSLAKVPGFLKIEFGSHILSEVVALKAKCYAIQYFPMREPNYGEGQKRGEQEQGPPAAAAIRTDGAHRLYTMSHRKKCLSAMDNKRKILEDGIHSQPYCVDADGRQVAWTLERDAGAEMLDELVGIMQESAASASTGNGWTGAAGEVGGATRAKSSLDDDADDISL